MKKLFWSLAFALVWLVCQPTIVYAQSGGTVTLTDCLPASVTNAVTNPPLSTTGGTLVLPNCGSGGGPARGQWFDASCPPCNTPAVHITLTAPLTIQGQTSCNGTPTTPTTSCTDATFIDLSGQASLDITASSATNFLRITGITFTDLSPSAQANGVIQIHSGTHGQQTFRIDHLHLLGNKGSGFIKEADSYGLNDHILAEDSGSTGIQPPFIPHGDGATRGFQNWTDPTNLGSGEAIYIENSTYNAQNGNTEGFYDCYEGAKVVARYNNLNYSGTVSNAGGTGCHGTDSGNLWSPVYQEFYNNTSTNNSSHSAIPGPQWRGGTGLFFNNVYTGSAAFQSNVLQYQRVDVPNNVGQWGDAIAGVNWIPVSTTPTNSNATVYSLNGNGATPAQDWVANNPYTTGAVIAPTVSNGSHAFFQMQASNCTSANVAQSTISWASSGGSTNTDGAGGCTWTNIAGDSRTTGVARAGFCAAHPDTMSSSDAACAAVVGGDTASRYLDCSAGVTNCSGNGYPFRDQPGVGHDQVSFPVYEWSNSGSQIHAQPLLSSTVALANRDFFDFNPSFNGTTGVGTGTLVPTNSSAYSGAPNCTTGVGYAVITNPAVPTLYKCVSTNTWAVYYTPYTYPHPLDTEGSTVTLLPANAMFANTGIGDPSPDSPVTFTLTNNSGSTVTSISISITGTDPGDFSDTTPPTTCGASLGDGDTCQIYVSFTPTAIGSRTATLSVSDSDPSSPQTATLSGMGVLESFTPDRVAFGDQAINTTSPNTRINFKYTGSGTLTLDTLTPTPTANFALNTTGITASPCNLSGMTSLTHNQTCGFNVTFSSGSALGPITGNVMASFTGDPNNSSLELLLSGTATQVLLSPKAIAFGIVVNPNTKVVSVTVTNEGTTALTFGATPTIAPSSAPYAVLPHSGSTSTCLAAGVSLMTSQHCTISVQFTPPAGSGTSFPATLTIFDSDPTGSQPVAITGKN
jgi:hypothetical protein